MKLNAKKAKTNFFISNIVYVLFFGFILRLLLAGFGTLKLDQGTFIAWSNVLVNGGFVNFYKSWSDYLPGYLYVLWILGKIQNILPTVLLYKLPAILADTATSYLIYKIVKKIKDEKWGIITASIYLFNPAVFANSALWGQVDSLTALTAVLSIYIFPTSIYLSAASLAVGTLIKPQTAFIFPIMVMLFIKYKRSIIEFLIYCLEGLVLFVLGFVPFWNHGTLISFIIERLGISANQYPYTSINAFNFWGLTGFWNKDILLTQVVGYFIPIAIFIFFTVKLWRKKNAEWFLASIVFASTFLFFTRMHERHLLPVFAPLTVALALEPVLIFPYIGFSLVYILNLFYSYHWITDNFAAVLSDIAVKFSILVALGSAIFLFWTQLTGKVSDFNFVELFTGLRKKFKDNKTSIQEKFPKINLSPTQLRALLIIVMSFAFIVRIFNLQSPPNEYFDEVYHAFTAKVILNPAEAHKAWEWWNTPPEGFAYEWTHPPLAKLGMALGMILLGQNSVGWRLPGAILGTICVYLVYLIAKELFKDELTAILSAAIFTLDGLTLVMSRIGMNDSYMLVFTLLAVLLFMRQKNFLSAVSFGLAISSKWSAIWAVPIMFVLWLKRKNKFTPSLFWFFILPPAIYLLTYFQMFLTGHGLNIWWGMQEQMWWYHTGLKATHAYSSPWWSWPFLIRPIYLYTSDEIAGTVARIYAMGNPLIFWFGLTSVITTFYYALIEKSKRAGLVVFSYLIFFAPWALSPRIMFLYHYLPSIPFMAIASGYVIRRNIKLAYWVFPLALILFIYFYPHWIGLQVPLWLDKSYYWVTSWR